MENAKILLLDYAAISEKPTNHFSPYSLSRK